MCKETFSSESTIINAEAADADSHDYSNDEKPIPTFESPLSPVLSPPQSPDYTPPDTPVDIDFPRFEDNPWFMRRLPPRPRIPEPWTWKCHRCHREYRLGVTRRCLFDGHYFCPGKRSDKKGKRHCKAEFDYVGWVDWNDWRDRIREINGDEDPLTPFGKHSCWKACNYPSECSDLGLHDYDGDEADDEADEDGQPSRKIRRLWR